MIIIKTAGHYMQRVNRAAIFAVPVALWLLFCWLWITDHHDLYNQILTHWAVVPFIWPFWDAHGVLAAAECHRLGYDVYVYNPCDISGRVHSYSPLWLLLLPSGLGTQQTTAVGIAIDFAFFATLPFVLRPQAILEMLICVAAIVSPMVAMGVERANVDLIIFTLVVVAGALYGHKGRVRGYSYVIFLFAGLLKFYPLCLSVLTVRERARVFVWSTAAVFGVLALFMTYYASELAEVLRHRFPGNPFMYSFSASNLPYNLIVPFPSLEKMFSGFSLYVMVTLGSFCLVAAVSLSRRLLVQPGVVDWASLQMRYLVIGATLIVSCFFAGPNINYRGIFFLLTLGGLKHLRIHVGRLRRILFVTIIAILLLMWGELLRSIVIDLISPENDHTTNVEVLFWIFRELTWWLVMSVLGAIVLAYVYQSQAMIDARSALRRFVNYVNLW